ncbi:unnamed protein product, partial [Laminaria digitata]
RKAARRKTAARAISNTKKRNGAHKAEKSRFAQHAPQSRNTFFGLRNTFRRRRKNCCALFRRRRKNNFFVFFRRSQFLFFGSVCSRKQTKNMFGGGYLGFSVYFSKKALNEHKLKCILGRI